MSLIIFFFQAEDGILVAQESRGLGDVYKRQLSAPWRRPPCMVQQRDPKIPETSAPDYAISETFESQGCRSEDYGVVDL